MKTTTITQIGCLICTALLLTGCASLPRWVPIPITLLHRTGSGCEALCFELEADGRLYWCQLDNIYVNGKYESATLYASLCKGYWVSEATLKAMQNGENHLLTQRVTSTGEALKEDCALSTEFRVLPMEVRPNYFRIIDEEGSGVLFEAPLEKLDLCVHWRDRLFSEEKLKEAMPQLIRENVKL